MRFVAIIEPVGYLAAVFRVIVVPQLKREGNQLGLLFPVQRGHFLLKLLKAHQQIIAVLLGFRKPQKNSSRLVSDRLDCRRRLVHV